MPDLLCWQRSSLDRPKSGLWTLAFCYEIHQEKEKHLICFVFGVCSSLDRSRDGFCTRVCGNIVHLLKKNKIVDLPCSEFSPLDRSRGDFCTLVCRYIVHLTKENGWLAVFRVFSIGPAQGWLLGVHRDRSLLAPQLYLLLPAWFRGGCATPSLHVRSGHLLPVEPSKRPRAGIRCAAAGMHRWDGVGGVWWRWWWWWWCAITMMTVLIEMNDEYNNGAKDVT